VPYRSLCPKRRGGGGSAGAPVEEPAARGLPQAQQQASKRPYGGFRPVQWDTDAGSTAQGRAVSGVRVPANPGGPTIRPMTPVEQ